MTPDKARALLDGTTPGPWHCRDDAGLLAVASDSGPVAIDVNEADAALVAAAPDMAAMRAGMRTEYRTEEWQGSYPGWVPTSPWTAKKPAGGSEPHARVVRRYVTTEEEIS